MITFKTFLIEGGKAMAKHDVDRATKADIEKALDIVSKTLGIERSVLEASLLGSTEVTLAGQKQDSGDIDIALSTDEISVEEADAKMLKLTKNRGYMNKGTKIGSYAVDVGGKKVQVDLMFVSSKEWAKFIFHSAHGRGSQYPGVVRNFLLMATVKHTQEAGKDLIVKKGDQVLARASRSLKLDVGLERLFKVATKSPRNGNLWSRNLSKVHPSRVQAQAEELTGKKVKFSHDPEIIDVPDEVAEFAFGPGVKAKDIMTAEQIIEHIKKLKNAAEIFKAAKADLELSNLPIPKEMP